MTKKPRLFVVVEEEGVVVVIQHIVQASPLYPAFELSLSVPQIVAVSLTTRSQVPGA